MERPSFVPENVAVLPSENEGREHLVASQAKYLKEVLKSLKVGYIPVRPSIHQEDADLYRDRKVIAITGMNESSLSLALSGGTKKGQAPLDAAVILPAPLAGESGFLTDSQGQLFCDSFWIFQDGAMKYIQPSQPIPVDLVSTMFDENREQAHFKRANESQKKLHDLSDDKVKTKRILEERGIPVPLGIYVDLDRDALEQVDKFIGANPQLEGYVHKSPSGAHGEGVIIFSRDQVEEFRSFVDEYYRHREKQVIVEERIIPRPLESLREKRYRIPESAEVDYNFRILVSLGKNPKVIDGEVRFKKSDTHPVNITYIYGGARAALLNVVEDEAMLAEMFHVSEEAVRILMEEAGVEEAEGAVAGADIITRDGVYVMEVNAGGPIGGFGTLTRLHHGQAPLVRERLMPIWEEQAEQNFMNRRAFKASDSKRLPHNKTDFNDLIVIWDMTEEYEKMWKLALEAGHDYEEQYRLCEILLHLAHKTGDSATAYNFFQEGIGRNNEHKKLYEASSKSLLGKRFYLGVADFWEVEAEQERLKKLH